jgi:hypothetical protein
MYIIRSALGETTDVSVTRFGCSDGATEYHLPEEALTLCYIDEEGIVIKVGRKSIRLNETQCNGLFALLHVINVDTHGRLGEPAIFQLKKDTGVPF